MKNRIAFGCLFMWIAFTAAAQKRIPSEQCENNAIKKMYGHYHVHYLTRMTGLELRKYKWDNDFVNCRLNLAEHNHRKASLFVGGGGLVFGAGAALVVAGTLLANVKENTNYQIGRAMLFSGIGTAMVSVPLFVLSDKYRKKAVKYSQEVKKAL